MGSIQSRKRFQHPNHMKSSSVTLLAVRKCFKAGWLLNNMFVFLCACTPFGKVLASLVDLLLNVGTILVKFGLDSGVFSLRNWEGIFCSPLMGLLCFAKCTFVDLNAGSTGLSFPSTWLVKTKVTCTGSWYDVSELLINPGPNRLINTKG